MGDSEETLSVLSLPGKRHLSEACHWSRVCGIDGGQEDHHWIVHQEKILPHFMEGNSIESNVDGN